MTGHRLLQAVVAVALLAVLPNELCAAGSETSRRADDLQMSIDTRWAGGANGGYYPIRIRLTNLGRPRVLEFVFAGAGGNESRLPTVSRQIQIDQNATQQFTVSIPLVSAGAYGELRVFENGRVLEQLSQHITLPDAQRGGPDRPSLLVISPSPAAVDCTSFEAAVVALAGGTMSSGGGRMVYAGAPGVRSNDFQAIAPQMLPEAWVDYTALDIVAIPLETFGKIASGARGALLHWTASGGTLIVYDVGAPADKSADLARLLDLPGRAPQTRIWRMADLELHRPINLMGATGRMPGAAPGGMGPMMMVGGGPVPAAGGNQFANVNEPLWHVVPETFYRLELGAGQIFAFPASPFPGAPIDWAWWLTSAKSQNLNWTARNGLSSRQSHSDFFTFLIPGVGAVPLTAFVVLISVFAILIGPVNYYVARRRRQLYLLVLTIPATAFLTSAALFGYAMIADGFGVQSRLRSFTLLDQYSKTAVSFNRISLYAGITPSAGLRFSPDTAVFPVWPDDSGLESGTFDWTNTQHLARGWLRTQTTAQFETISIRAERGRVDVRPADSGTIEVANGLEWDIDNLVVRDEKGRLYAGRHLPAGASAKLALASREDLQALAGVLAADSLKAPPGAGVPEYNPFNRGSRRAMMMPHAYYIDQQAHASFGNGVLESYLRVLTKAAQDAEAGGLAPRTYLATFSKNPGIELGIDPTRPAPGLHVLMGYF